MIHSHLRRRIIYGVGLMVLSLVTVGPAWSLNSPQSTGPGVSQGEDGSMSTKQGGNTGTTTGRNEDSGSATGKVREPSQAEPPRDHNRNSSKKGSGLSQESNQTSRQQSGGQMNNAQNK